VVWTLVILPQHPAFSPLPSPLCLKHRLRRLPVSRHQHLVHLPQARLLLLLRPVQVKDPLRRLPISRLRHLVHLPQARLLLLLRSVQHLPAIPAHSHPVLLPALLPWLHRCPLRRLPKFGIYERLMVMTIPLVLSSHPSSITVGPSCPLSTINISCT
jgi:hypothetical protein